jgi:hypothetical protein
LLFTKQFGLTAEYLGCIQDLNLDQETSYPDWHFQGSPQSLLANARISKMFMPVLFAGYIHESKRMKR